MSDGFGFPVEASHVLMFARAIGDAATERAVQEMAPGDTVAVPPTFLVASCHFDPDYPLRPRHGGPWIGTDPTALAGGGRGMLAERHFEYLRPVHVGDHLTVALTPGRSWEKSGSQGVLAFNETVSEFRGADGEIAARMRTVTVEVHPAGEAQ